MGIPRRGYLGLGSNVGDRRANLQAAVDALPAHGVAVVASSSTYDTDPVGEVLDQPSFLNACVRVETDHGPEEWTATIPAAELADGDRTCVLADGTPVLLVRQGGTVHAIHDRCSHRGCSLAGGEISAGVVECPCHGSRVRLSDGQLVRGPATAPQPAFDARERDGRVEVRRRP